MTLDKIKSLAIKTEPYDTNNSWGFGGGIGTSYKFANGCELRIGTAYYRHLRSHRYCALYNPKGKRVLDKAGSPNAEAIKDIFEIVTRKI